jgi:hypothetical protein
VRELNGQVRVRGWKTRDRLKVLVHKLHAGARVCFLSQAVGVFGNDSNFYAGSMTADASRKVRGGMREV